MSGPGHPWFWQGFDYMNTTHIHGNGYTGTQIVWGEFRVSVSAFD